MRSRPFGGNVDLRPIFKAYDVRGRSPGELEPAMAWRIGAAFASFAGAGQIAVGRDCRPSSPALSAAFMEGAAATGADVVDLGEITTDMLYYVAGSQSMPGAVITASHNPPEYNGIKMCLAGAAPVGAESGLEEIRAAAETGIEPAATPGRIEPADHRRGFVAHLLGIVDPAAIAPLRVVVDGGNGMAGIAIPEIFEAIPAELDGLYLEPDGTFPNHPADPLRPENLTDLLKRMNETGADLGVAFDGDADRAFFVDDRLEPLSGSTTTAIVAGWFLEREPGATIVHNLICSRAVPEMVRQRGGVPVRTRVGHSYIKQVMAETGAVFGGEHSGHYYFRSNYRADSGMLAMLVLMQVLSESGRPLSELRTEYEPYHASGEINLRVDDQPRAMQAVAASCSGAAIDWTDGLTVAWPDRWFNLRPSNTEPLLRLNAEAERPDDVDALVARVRTIAGGDDA